MYRAVTLYSIENGIFNGDVIDTEKLKEAIRDIRITFRPNPETGRPDTYLNGMNVENKIRTMGGFVQSQPYQRTRFCTRSDGSTATGLDRKDRQTA